MKTLLPERITTVQQAKQFLQELNRNNEIFHPKDDARGVLFNLIPEDQRPTINERIQLNRLMADIRSLRGFDVFDFIVSL